MAHSDRDHRGRRRSAKDCWDSIAGGCPYCQTGSYKRAARKRNRQDGRREARNG